MHSSPRELSFEEAEPSLGELIASLLGERPDFETAKKTRPIVGSLIGSWGQGPGLRKYKTFAFRDTDRAPVVLDIMRRGDALGEIEIMRGDNQPVRHFPPLAELKAITGPGPVTFDD